MERKLESVKNRKKNILQLIKFRELNAENCRYFQKHCQFTYELIKRLGFEYELQGHQGCVNCLEWTKDGRFLASGSDDTQVIIWDPLKHKQIHQVPTNHIGNIFSVKFLGTNNNIVATAAGDCRVIVQSIDGTEILDCNCHKNRVKRLANSPTEPTVFWSAGEDGRVLQYDLREPHDCYTKSSSLLISFRNSCEVKCVTANPTKPHYLAVGCNDAYVRLFDRRKIKPYPFSQINDNEFIYPGKSRLNDSNCVQYFAPGHLAIDNQKVDHSRYVVTYVTFNSAGSEMLVNMGGEQIYLFDINRNREFSEIRFPETGRKSKTRNATEQCKCNNDSYVPDNFSGIPNLKSIPKCPCYYMRRAFHLLKRKWIGDLYCAARDYLFVTQQWPNEIKAYIGLIKCFIALGWTEDAKKWYDFLCKFEPDFLSQRKAESLSNAIRLLENTVKESVADNVELTPTDEDEIARRLRAKDYELRFMGHCNMTTDIMEANFLGENGEFICAGSDEGKIFIWERKTQSIVKVLIGDVSIVNCLQPHPSTCLIASSGIDPVVKLWSPSAEDDLENVHDIKDIESVVRSNQQRLAMDPFDILLISMGYQMQVLHCTMYLIFGVLNFFIFPL